MNCRLILTIARGVEHAGEWAMGRASARESAAREVYFGPGHGLRETRVLDRAALGNEPLCGPAIIEEYDTSVVVPPDCRVALDSHGNIVMQVGA